MMRQSNDALPQAMTPVKNAETMKFCCLFMTKYIPAEHTAADIVLNIKKNFLPNLSINKILIRFAGSAADNEMSDSIKTELDIVDEQVPICACDPEWTTYCVTSQTVAD